MATPGMMEMPDHVLDRLDFLQRYGKEVLAVQYGWPQMTDKMRRIVFATMASVAGDYIALQQEHLEPNWHPRDWPEPFELALDWLQGGDA